MISKGEPRSKGRSVSYTVGQGLGPVYLNTYRLCTDISWILRLTFNSLSCMFSKHLNIKLIPSVQNSPANAGDIRDTGFIPGLGRSPGEGNGSPRWHPCL